MRGNILSIFLILISPFTVNRQHSYNTSDNLKFKHFSTKEGLSQGSVIAILQDHHGYLWFGTRDGLNKYDGVNNQFERLIVETFLRFPKVMQ